jgi:hypothetical protein
VGEAGGGIATADGILGRGVLKESRPLDGEFGVPMPMLENLPVVGGFGVVNGEDGVRVGEGDSCANDEIGVLELSETSEMREGLVAPVSRELSCFAVIPIYLEARDPAVNLFGVEVEELRTCVEDVGSAVLIGPRGRECAAGVDAGVTRPEDRDGVLRPVVDGVTLPLDKEVDDMIRLDTDDGKDGVIRPETDVVI